ncbi:MAG: lipopolysaccharide transport periplasmic protein LptA [Halothiobacillaceae bacterium]|nr:MAG: lipopolysaccharide transport periplasmic protein LptA [Halothiobacillaceae bacterium]
MIAMNRPALKTCLLSMALLLATPLLATPASAASADRTMPLEIEADRKHTDYKGGEAVYEGNVIIRQGQLLLKADRATIHLRDGQFERAVLEGKPATYQDRDEDGQPINGQAQRMDYQAREDRITLTGQAKVQRAADTLASERIVYNLKTEVVDAGAGGGDRVRMVLQPRGGNEPKARGEQP